MKEYLKPFENTKNQLKHYVTIDFLKNHPHKIKRCAEIWLEVLGKIWVPEVTLDQVVENLHNHLNDNQLPITFVALDDEVPVGMCSLRKNDGILPNLMPWLGSLVVDPVYQKQGIGNKLVEVTKLKAQELGFDTLHLFAFDATIPEYYQRLGWNIISMDNFKRHPVTVMQCLLI